MARLNQNYYADEVYLDKRNRVLTLKPEWIEKLERLDNIPNVINNLNSTSKTDALSANMGRILKELIDQGGGGGGCDFSDKVMMQPEYDRLPDSKYTDGQLYLIFTESRV